MVAQQHASYQFSLFQHSPMKAKHQQISLFILLIINAFSLSAQTFRASAPSQVPVGQDFEISWEINEGAADFRLPTSPDFQVSGGPTQSSSTLMVNGNISSSVAITYYFRALRAGHFTIPPATIRIGRGTLKSNSVTIEVTQGQSRPNAGNNPRNAPGSGNNGRGRQAPADEGGGEYFIRAIPSKSSVMQGEPLVVLYKVFVYNAGMEQFVPKKSPSFSGFWVKDLPKETDNAFHEEVIDGKRYQVATIKKSILYPQKSGMLSLDAMDADAIVTLRSKGRRNNNPFGDDPFFDDFFGNTESFRKTISSKAVGIRVQPLPEAGKPENFSGLVGNFNINASVNKTTLKENDALTYKVSVSGNGNIQQIEAFKLNLPPDWDVYDPKSTDIANGRSFEYTIIPKRRGNYTIPALSFSYYDLSKRQYITLNSKEFAITVEKGNGSPAALPSAAISDKQDVKLLGQDIRYIKENPEGFADQDSAAFFGSTGFFALASFPFIALIGLAFYRRKREEEQSDIAGARRRKATGVARKRLIQAATAMKSGDKRLFYDEILKAINGYFADKLGLPLSEVSHQRMTRLLQQHQVPENLISHLETVLSRAEMSVYAPTAASDSMQSFYTDAESLINSLESALKTVPVYAA